jgi:hypothetical protein
MPMMTRLFRAAGRERAEHRLVRRCAGPGKSFNSAAGRVLPQPPSARHARLTESAGEPN